jgi:hypothetical protein
MEMEKHKILYQGRLANTTANSLLVPALKQKFIVTNIFLCNTTAGAITANLFFTTTGVVWGVTNALYYNLAIAAASTEKLVFSLPVAVDYSGGIGAQSNTADALTITIFGYEVEGSSRV